MKLLRNQRMHADREIAPLVPRSAIPGGLCERPINTRLGDLICLKYTKTLLLTRMINR